MKHLVSLLLITLLVCPAYAMEEEQQPVNFLKKLEGKAKEYVDDDAAFRQILIYFCFGKIDVTQFKKALKTKNLMKDLAKFLHISEETLNLYFDKIAPIIPEVTNIPALNNVMATFARGEKPAAGLLEAIIDKEKAASLIGKQIGVDPRMLYGLMQQLINDELAAAIATLKDEINAIITEDLDSQLIILGNNIQDTATKYGICRNGLLQLKEIAGKPSPSQTSNLQTMGATGGIAAGAIMLNQSLCLNCDSYVQNPWLFAGSLVVGGVTTGIYRYLAYRQASQQLQAPLESQTMKDESAKKAALKMKLAKLLSDQKDVQLQIQARMQKKTALQQQLTDLENAEKARGSISEQGWQLLKQAMTHQAMNYLRGDAKEGEEVPFEVSPEIAAFKASLKPAQIAQIEEKFKFFGMLPTAILIDEIDFLASLENDQCTALSGLLESEFTRKIAGFNNFARLLTEEQLNSLKVTARLLLAEYNPELLFYYEDEFINSLEGEQATLFFEMLPERLQKALLAKE